MTMDRTDRFEEWWAEHRPSALDVTLEQRDQMWELCRAAWYESKRIAEKR